MSCKHIEKVDLEKFRDYKECTDCVLRKDTWKNLNTCLTCGNTRCCDSSPNQHATAHFKATGHELIRINGDNNAIWCYVDETYVK